MVALAGDYRPFFYRDAGRSGRRQRRVPLHLHIILNAVMTSEKTSQTILTILTGLLIIYLVSGLKPVLAIAVILGIIGIFSGYLSEKISRLWFMLAEGMGFVSSRVLLTVVFFGLLLPLAILSRLFGRKGLELARRESSYYVTRNHKYEADDLNNIW